MTSQPPSKRGSSPERNESDPTLQNVGNGAGFSPALRNVAFLLCLAVFPLLLVGAGVTTKGAGMAYPDWPTSDGHLVNPPSWTEQEHTLWEHGHRLIGWFVGMLAIATVVLAHRSRPIVASDRGDSLPLKLAWASLLMIILQGVLGGLRVLGVSTELAMVHGILGQTCFAVVFWLAVVSSRRWSRLGRPVPSKSAAATRTFSIILVGIVFVQLVLGGWLRHFKADLALGGHLIWLIVVCFSIGWMTLWVMGRHHHRRFLVQMTQFLAILLTIQLFFGSITFMIRTMNMDISDPWYWLVPSVHLGLGALILAGSVSVAGVACRVLALPVGGQNRESGVADEHEAIADTADGISRVMEGGAVERPAT